VSIWRVQPRHCFKFLAQTRSLLLKSTALSLRKKSDLLSHALCCDAVPGQKPTPLRILTRSSSLTASPTSPRLLASDRFLNCASHLDLTTILTPSLGNKSTSTGATPAIAQHDDLRLLPVSDLFAPFMVFSEWSSGPEWTNGKWLTPADSSHTRPTSSTSPSHALRAQKNQSLLHPNSVTLVAKHPLTTSVVRKMSQ
jgi:hypothetical protein